MTKISFAFHLNSKAKRQITLLVRGIIVILDAANRHFIWFEGDLRSLFHLFSINI